jgi:hypothetical protein
VSGARDGHICVWDWETGTLIKNITAHTSYVKEIRVLPDGQLCSTSADDTFKVWNMETYEPTKSVNMGNTTYAITLMAPKGNTNALVPKPIVDETEVQTHFKSLQVTHSTDEVKMLVDTWHRVIVSRMKDGSVRVFVDGATAVTINAPEGFLPGDFAASALINAFPSKYQSVYEGKDGDIGPALELCKGQWDISSVQFRNKAIDPERAASYGSTGVERKPVSVFARKLTTELEETLDTNVGKLLTFTVVRGGKLLDYEIKVDDLHAITPKSYLEVGDCVLNDLSYHSAKAHHLPVGGVYVAKAGCVSALFSNTLAACFWVHRRT